MTKVTTAQIRKIHVLARERAMDEELLHLYISNLIHKDSIRSLTVTEAVRVIDGLSGRGTDPGRERATARQMHYIRGLLVRLGWTDAEGKADMDRLDGLLRSRFSLSSHRWLDRQKASQVIEGLKAMVERKEEGVC